MESRDPYASQAAGRVLHGSNSIKQTDHHAGKRSVTRQSLERGLAEAETRRPASS